MAVWRASKGKMGMIIFKIQYCLCPGLLAAWPYLLFGVWKWGSMEWIAQAPGAGKKPPQQAHLNAAGSSINTLHPYPIGSKKASCLNISSQLAGIVCFSNPWSFRQPSIRSSCRRCFYSCVGPQPFCRGRCAFPPTTDQWLFVLISVFIMGEQVTIYRSIMHITKQFRSFLRLHLKSELFIIF